MSALVELPWPPHTLSGHNSGQWRGKSGVIARHREWAKLATMATMPAVPAAGDIRVVATFYPPDRRGDRINFPNRLKPYWDGIADALKVNDSRFLPHYIFAEPSKPGKVVILIQTEGE